MTEGLVPLDNWLEGRREKIERLTPHEAFAAKEQGAWFIDIRPSRKKQAAELIPGAIEIELDILPWRIHPDAGESQQFDVKAEDLVVLICDHGYSSSDAAATLREMGFNATDVEGGFQAWKEAGLPVVTHSPLDQPANINTAGENL